MTTAKLTAIGDGLGVVLPAAAIERLQGAEGDEVRLIETAKGVEIQILATDVASQLDAARKVMKEDESVLRRLAE